MPQRRRGARVLGPYPNGDAWRIVVVDDEGGRASSVCPTEAEALDLKRLTEERIREESSKTVSEAIDEYETHLRDGKGNKAVSVTETVRRLRLFLPGGPLLRSISPERAARLYSEFSTRTKKNGKPISVDYHRNALAEVKSFFGWCARQRWIRFSPFAEVKGVGKRKHGKPQLRIDEARAWMAVASRRAETEPGAVAAMATLLLGVRASEITKRVVRDLDDEGRLLWIDDTKTDAGRRQVEVPEALRVHLRRLAQGQAPGDLLFGAHWRDWPRKWVQKICREAGVLTVSAHAMRGLHSTLALSAGATGHLVAGALGHESFATTERSYADPAALQTARQRAALKVLDGGSNRSRGVPSAARERTTKTKS